MMSENSTGGATFSKREAAQVMAEVGGVRSSDDPAPGPAVAGFGQPAEERRDATCSAEVKNSEGRGDGPRGLPAPENVRQLQITLGQRASAFRQRNSESRMRENRSSGLMRGGKQTVPGPRAFQSVACRLLYTPDASTRTLPPSQPQTPPPSIRRSGNFICTRFSKRLECRATSVFRAQIFASNLLSLL
jgi:hypothetical protein